MEFVPDEVLMAYADDALAGDERASLEVRLATDPVLRRRLKPFEVTREVFSELFDRPLREQSPPHLVAAINAMTVPPHRRGQAAGARPTPLSERLRSFGQSLLPWNLEVRHAVALSATLLVGGAAGWMLKHAPEGTTQVALETGGLVALGALQQALETVPSLKTASWRASDGTETIITPVVSFRSKDGSYCREYEIKAAAGRRFVGYGCRGTDQTWGIAFHTEVETVKTPVIKLPEGDYRSAGPSSGSLALDSVIDRVIDGDAYGTPQENELIDKAWSVTID